MEQPKPFRDGKITHSEEKKQKERAEGMEEDRSDGKTKTSRGGK